MSTINWEDFDHIHVINKLKQVINAWWNADIVFTDEQGHLRAVTTKTKLMNPAVEFFLSRDPARENLSELVAKCIADLRQSNNHFTIRKWEMAGLEICVCPISIDNDFMGAVIGVGFFKDQNEQDTIQNFRDRMTAFGATADLTDRALARMRFLKEEDRERFTELVELVAQEVVTLHVEISSREKRILELNSELGSRYKYDNMIGKSKPMQDLYNLLDKIKMSESTIMIQGENGTGKELIAKAIHFNSPRKTKSFVIQNCSAFNDNLLDSELFGHVRGSFTGAIKDKKGLFEMADKGTFFLDEIGDTSPAMQVKLLRVIQEGTFLPVGATEVKRVDVRIIAATNADLKEMVAKGTFREDLYYRLNVINIRVPALRERKEDIPLLIEHFLEKASEKSGHKKVITKRALELMFEYTWHGNIRELQNEVERLVVISGDEQKIAAEMLSNRILEETSASKIQGSRIEGKLKDALEELEREMIREGLRRTGWNKSKLAKELGISRAGLIMKVEKYGLDKRRLPRT